MASPDSPSRFIKDFFDTSRKLNPIKESRAQQRNHRPSHIYNAKETIDQRIKDVQQRRASQRKKFQIRTDNHFSEWRNDEKSIKQTFEGKHQRQPYDQFKDEADLINGTANEQADGSGKVRKDQAKMHRTVRSKENFRVKEDFKKNTKTMTENKKGEFSVISMQREFGLGEIYPTEILLKKIKKFIVDHRTVLEPSKDEIFLELLTSHLTKL